MSGSEDLHECDNLLAFSSLRASLSVRVSYLKPKILNNHCGLCKFMHGLPMTSHHFSRHFTKSEDLQRCSDSLYLLSLHFPERWRKVSLHARSLARPQFVRLVLPTLLASVYQRIWSPLGHASPQPVLPPQTSVQPLVFRH